MSICPVGHLGATLQPPWPSNICPSGHTQLNPSAPAMKGDLQMQEITPFYFLGYFVGSGQEQRLLMKMRPGAQLHANGRNGATTNCKEQSMQVVDPLINPATQSHSHWLLVAFQK